MKVKFLGHASLEIRDNKTGMVLDPYLEKSCWAGQLYVTETSDDWRQCLKQSDVIIFSHAHDDHYNEGMIRANWPLFRDKTVVIPKFRARFFPKRLAEIGFTDVIELDENETLSFGQIDLSVSINHSDMDSSWLFEGGAGRTVLAQTDNLDLESLKRYSGKVDCYGTCMGKLAYSRHS